jgi:hypothetical protein
MFAEDKVRVEADILALKKAYFCLKNQKNRYARRVTHPSEVEKKKVEYNASRHVKPTLEKISDQVWKD